MAALKDTFMAFASIGAGAAKPSDIDSKNFLKCCKDSGMLNAKFTSTDVDLIFTQVKTKGAKRMTYAEFEVAVDKIADKKGITREEVEAKITAASPSFNATKAEAVKYHDDKSLYTGVYAKGGPTNVDKEKAGGLAGLLDRSEADVRGVKVSAKTPWSAMASQ